MSLMTYEDARPWARSIKTRVSKREMPPWGIDKNVGIQEFKERHLPDRRRNRESREVGRRRRTDGQSRRHADAAHV